MSEIGEELGKIFIEVLGPVLRDLHMLKTAFSRMGKEGVVEEVDAEKGYRVKLDEGEDGQPYLSGWVPHPETAKSSVPLKKGMRVGLFCPGGDIRQAMIFRSGYSDAHPSPNQDMEANVFEDAGVKVTIANSTLTSLIGAANFVQSGDGVTLTAGGTTFSFTGAGFTQTGGMQMHDGKDVGATHTNEGLKVD
jgi:hypothetical protein